MEAETSSRVSRMADARTFPTGQQVGEGDDPQDMGGRGGGYHQSRL